MVKFCFEFIIFNKDIAVSYMEFPYLGEMYYLTIVVFIFIGKAF